MALQSQTLPIIITYIILLHFTQSDLIQCLSGGTECNCPTTTLPSESCTLLCDNINICIKKTLNCRSNNACSIACYNNTSCTDAIIQPNSATDLNITCYGTDACKDIRIECGTGHCILHCNTQSSCLDIDSIDITNAQSFQCNGDCPSNTIIPAPFTQPQQTPTSPPTPYPTPNPTKYPTDISQSPSLYPTASPIHTPTISPTNNPTISPLYKSTTRPSLIHTISPTNKPTKTPSKLRVSPRPTMDIMVEHSSLVPTMFLNTLAEKELAAQHKTLMLDNTCWIIIGICTAIVTCVCCIAFGLVYLNHKHTQKMLNTYFANVNSTKYENNNNKYNHNPHPSMILNPYQLPSIYDANPLAMNPNIHSNVSNVNSNINPSFGTPKLTPDLNASLAHSFPMQYNNILSPSDGNININNVSLNSLHNPEHHNEGTDTNIHKISDIPALPQQVDDTMNRQHIQQRMHHRHRTSLHMTPAGYMDEKFVTKKKKSDDSSVSIVMPAPSTSNIHKNEKHERNVSNAHSMVNTVGTPNSPNTIELLNVKRHNKNNTNNTNMSNLTFVEIYNDRKSMDVDDIEIQSETRNASGVDIVEMKDENDTDTDLSKELFATNSPSNSIKNGKLIKAKSKSKSKSNSKNGQNDLFYQYHNIGSLPVIISPNNKEYKNNFEEHLHKNEQIRPNSAILVPHMNSTYESSPEPLQLPLLLNNNNISPLKEHSESKYNDNNSDHTSTYSSSHEDINNLSDNNYYNNKYYKSPSHTCSINTRYTKHSQSIISDLESHNSDDDDDTYIEIKPMSESVIPKSMPPPINENNEHDQDDEYAHIERILNENDNDNENDSENDSETSVINNNMVDDEIILYHANKLMNLISDEDSHHNEHNKYNVKNNNDSISMFV